MYELYPYFTNDGTVGLFSKGDDDIYHSTYGALSESWQKFILPSHLPEYIKTHDSIKILDICYGIGYNTKAALNVFIENYLKNIRIKKLNNETIYTDNICNENTTYNCHKNHDEQEFKNLESTEKKLVNINTNVAIDSDNIASGLLDKNSVKNKSLLIDAVDTDKILINISPFITRGRKNSILIKRYISNKYYNQENCNNKLAQVLKIKQIKLKPLNKKYKLKKEVSMILFQKLFDQSKDLFSDKILQAILEQNKFKPFFDDSMINFAKFYSKNRLNYIKSLNIYVFLHNIYYRYVSRSYKNVSNILKNNDIDITFHQKDARKYIKETSNTYNFIFLDAFTPAKCPALWTIQFFNELYNRLEKDGMLLTYSSSAAIRNALLQNGFFVGKSYDSQLKKFVGTIATKDASLIEYPLDSKDLSLITSRAGICFNDEFLELDNETIIKNREVEIKESNLISSSKVLKEYR